MSDARVPLEDDFLTLARLALGEKPQDVQLFLSRAARRYRGDDQRVADQLSALLKTAGSRSSVLRREAGIPVPVDSDSRLHLLRTEPPSSEAAAPLLVGEVEAQIKGLIHERKNLGRLSAAGLEPTRSVLFVGPPGVGKTMSARWIASQLGLPLLILDLSAVMSSFLGRTGNNVRAVLDYAKRQSCVLLLDELDAIAKRRDDATEIGELKRLVTVLLQEIDEWPASGLLVAATNHPELLDPAVWRRFDMLVRFPPPTQGEIGNAVRTFLGGHAVGDEWVDVLAVVLGHGSYSEIEKRIIAIRRAAALSDKPLEAELRKFLSSRIGELDHTEKLALADKLAAIPTISQRTAADITGVSRDTIRRRRSKVSGGNHG
ncbi:hypothetical protein ER13_04005 [Brevundimonas sp. EAKA]|uniref:AAA family ATPase n=1 Tax=Brevundimonas sp. EAKA TaxID=1495854 RepID=UPI0004A9AAD2|nr:ATP-binding protein [Brevundimonas sp. EAKA]KDP95298.1 hypothetical protein ER13_04005 [Brevundimonas sp. EAKA]